MQTKYNDLMVNHRQVGVYHNGERSLYPSFQIMSLYGQTNSWVGISVTTEKSNTNRLLERWKDELPPLALKYIQRGQKQAAMRIMGIVG